jgi:F420-0:gamma-glutamyl ligase-like protein
MTIETKLRAGLTASLLLSLWMSVMWGNAGNKVIDQKNTIDSLTKVTDSLHNELFNAQVEIGRHEITREEILKPNKELNKRYEEYYNHETE